MKKIPRANIYKIYPEEVEYNDEVVSSFDAFILGAFDGLVKPDIDFNIEVIFDEGDEAGFAFYQSGYDRDSERKYEIVSDNSMQLLRPFSEVIPGAEDIVEEDYLLVDAEQILDSENVLIKLDYMKTLNLNSVDDEDFERFPSLGDAFRNREEIVDYMSEDPNNLAIGNATIVHAKDLKKAIEGIGGIEEKEGVNGSTYIQRGGDVAIITDEKYTRSNTPSNPRKVVYEPSTNENSLVKELAQEVNKNLELELEQEARKSTSFSP